MIVLREATVSLPQAAPNPTTVLDHISLTIRRGEWVALLGPNGSGKTTLLHTIAGLTAPASGELSFVSTESEPAACRPRTALLLQEPDNQFVTSSVRHELELSPPPGVKDREAVSSRIRSAVDRFTLGQLLGRNPHRLSGGEKQRLALATVWLQDPELLLLDEPTAYLDQEAAADCTAFLREMHDRGVTVIWATPGGEELTCAERVVCVDGGRIEFSGNLDEFYAWSGPARFDYIPPPVKQLATELLSKDDDAGGVSVLDATVADTNALARKIAEGIPAGGLDGNKGVENPWSPKPVSGEQVLSYSSVNFGYGEIAAVRDFDLDVHAGECVGIAGPNGAGKSTLLELAGCVYEPDSGTLRRKYRRVASDGRQNVFYLFQSPEKLFFAETVLEEITFGLRNLGVSRDSFERRASEALEAVGLDPGTFLSRSPFSLSLGEMRRVALAITLALQPQLLLLDEPTSCLDPTGRIALTRLLSRYREEGRTVLVASHETAFLAEVCDRIVWLCDGRTAAVVETSGGELEAGVAWPEAPPPPILALQDELAAMGLPVVPRALTPKRLIKRLNEK